MRQVMQARIQTLDWKGCWRTYKPTENGSTRRMPKPVQIGRRMTWSYQILSANQSIPIGCSIIANRNSMSLDFPICVFKISA